jgi:hypothetical protein
MVVGMDAGAVIERVQQIVAVRGDIDADADVLESGLVALRELTSWVDAQHAVLVGRLAGRDSFAVKRIAAAGRPSLVAAERSAARSRTLAATPRLADHLDDGSITAGHVDAVTRACSQLDPAQRSELFGRVDQLGAVAVAGTVEEFDRRVRLEVKRLQSDDGMDRLARQRRDCRVSTWVDSDGMWNLRGRLDPVTGMRLDAKLNTSVEAMFATEVPEECPADPIEKQKFLAAHALANLIEGTAAAAPSGRAEFVVVIDADATDQPGPVAQWPIPVEIPSRVLADLMDENDVHAVVVRNGIVLHAPGELNLGRSTRLANRAQRRALRGLYRGCAIPGCAVSYERCKLHHIMWWRHGGVTDLDNLIPVCSRHHGNIHHDGWIIILGPNRQLTLRLPDGTIHTTGPPDRRSAA